jgi:flagellar basal body rod protein FlgG
MNYGLYISTSGMLTSMTRMDVASNNLANVTTDGFKADMISVRQRDVARVEDGLFHMDSNALLERLGAGVMPSQTRVDMEQGSIRMTDNPLDLAIEGEGLIGIASGAGEDGERFTRNGRLTISDSGELVLAANGRAVEREGGGTIRVDPSLEVEILSNGAVVQGGTEVGRLRFVSVQGGVVKEGDNLLKALGEAVTEPAAGRIQQGAVEQSGVSAIDAIMAVTGAGKSAQANAKMIGYFDETMNQAIGTLGRVN